MNKILLAFVVGIFLLSFTSALDFDNVVSEKELIKDAPIMIGEKEIPYNSLWTKYPVIEIDNSYGLKIPFLDNKLAELALTEHTESCSSDDCFSIFEINTYTDSALIEDVKFYTLIDDGVTLDSPREQNIRGYQFYYWGEIADYETVCKKGKTIIDIKNGTEYTPETCYENQIGSHQDWIPFNIGQVFNAGNYRVKLIGSKRPSRAIDWVITTQGKEIGIDLWATWGNISTGSQAEVRLNSPANGAIAYTNPVTLNATANVTGGAYLVNATLWDSSTGTWGARNTSNITNVALTTETNPYTVNERTTTAYIYKSGMRIKPLINMKVQSFNSSSLGQATKGYILDASKSVLATTDIINNVSTFTGGFDLIANTTYYLAIDKAGTAYSARTDDSVTYPSYSAHINWTGGLDNFNGGDVSNTAFSIVSVSYGDTSTNSTRTFTNIYPIGSNTKWNYQFCDSDGACGFATSNYTFSIDSQAPTIALNYPTSLINYGALNQSLQLNFTATDTNLDDVWYNYNGTNITIVGAVSGVTNLSNITLTTKKNVTIYANDTVGNLNTTTFSWDYRVFENSRTYNTTSLELLDNTYVLNLSNNVNTTSVTLNYDGTDYSTTGSAGIYTVTLTAPAVTTITNKTLYWKVLYNNLETINTYSSNQTLQPVVFNICNSTINQTLINFTTRSATNPFPLLNTTFKIAFDYSLSRGGTQKTFNYDDMVENNSSYAFCSNTNLTIYTNADIEYDAGGYALNFYYLTGEQVLTTSSPTNISLYLLNDSAATVTQLKVQDSSQRGLNDYRIDVYSYDTGTGAYYLVGMAKTDFNGLDIFYFNWFDTIYKFLVYDNSGTLVKNTGNTKVSSTPVTITLGDSVNFTQDKFEGFTKNLSFNAVSNNFVLTFTKPSVLIQSVCLRVDKQNNSGNNKICDTCTNATSATLYCNIGSYGNGTYIAYMYATGSRSILDLLYASIGGELQDTIYASLGNKDASFYAFLFATLVMLAMFVHPVMGILGLFLGILGASALGFTSLNWSQFLGIGVVGGIIIWVLKK